MTNSTGTTGLLQRARRGIGLVRLRQLADQIRHRLSFVPILYVLAAIALVQLLLLVDRELTEESMPTWFETTVESARSVFSAMAGGLITSITLLLSMMLVAIQLASTQFSPRTMRDWLSDRTMQHAIGLVLGTTVFCLLALRSTRDFAEDETAIVPHLTVLVAVALGVVSLVAVVRSVDHLTHSVRVGAVAERVAAETIDVVDRTGESLPVGQAPGALPSTQPSAVLTPQTAIPDDALAIESPTAGWIQQLDADALLDALPDGSTAIVTVSIGGFVPERAPLVWISPPPAADDTCRSAVLDAFAIGDGRTMQQDVEFGLVQLTDIAVRALSPGVNDPTTAEDVIVHIGGVLIAIWSHEEPSGVRTKNGCRAVMPQATHESYLSRSTGPIRRYGAGDPLVLSTLLRTLLQVRSEVERRGLPGPLHPLDEAIAATIAAAETSTWSELERRRFTSIGRISAES
jgi:uncharacterized membrane protein